MIERAIDRVRAAVSARRRHATVPEWDGLDLYFGPLTTSDMIAVDERMPPRPKEGENDGSWRHERNIVLLILKAENEDGTPAFELGDKELLLSKADYLVVQRLVGEIYSAGMKPVSVDAAKPSSETTASSVSE